MKLMDRTGEVNTNNQGLKMTVIRYKNAKDIDVQFEDGTISEHKEYNKFKLGKIKNPNYNPNNNTALRMEGLNTKKKLIKHAGKVELMTFEQVYKKFIKFKYHKEFISWSNYFEEDELEHIRGMGLIKGFNKADSIQDKIEFSNYAKIIILNDCKLAYKKRCSEKNGGKAIFCSFDSKISKDKNKSDSLTVEETIKDENEITDRNIIKNEIIQDIKDIIKSLTKEQQELYDLYFNKGYDCVKIERIKNINKNTLYARLSKMKKDIAKKLVAYNIDRECLAYIA